MDIQRLAMAHCKVQIFFFFHSICNILKTLYISLWLDFVVQVTKPVQTTLLFHHSESTRLYQLILEIPYFLRPTLFVLFEKSNFLREHHLLSCLPFKNV